MVVKPKVLWRKCLRVILRENDELVWISVGWGDFVYLVFGKSFLREKSLNSSIVRVSEAFLFFDLRRTWDLTEKRPTHPFRADISIHRNLCQVLILLSFFSFPRMLNTINLICFNLLSRIVMRSTILKKLVLSIFMLL